MQYVEYIQNGQEGSNSKGWYIDLGYTPSQTTNVKMKCKVYYPNTQQDGQLFIGCSESGYKKFRLFGFTSAPGQMAFDCPYSNGGARILCNYTGVTEWECGAIESGVTFLNNLTAGISVTGQSFVSREFNVPFSVWYSGVVKSTQGSQIYYIEFYENDVKVKSYLPALDNNNTPCLYEELGGTFHYNSGNTLTAGPILSSIIATPSNRTLAASGETITIVVDTENAWTVSGDTFLTLSSTGDTSGATITATAPSYSGVTNRTDTLTFIDSVTSDEASLTISQKKYQSGQPFYLGGDDVGECYIGGDAVIEAYLGEDLVFSSGPFTGLKLSPKELKFRNTTIATGDTQSLYVKSSEDWTISTDADWFTLSPSSGLGNSQKTEVTLTVISIPSAETTNTITCTSANYSASAETLYKVGYGIPANEIWYATQDNSSITNLNRWKVYDKNGVQMTTVDFSTYGKMVFPRAIGYVAADPYYTTYNWDKLTEIGFPEMEPSLCTGANDFGMRYFATRLQYWTRIYGDYPYISADETHMWGSDGTGGAYVRGKTGTLTIAEGVKTLGPYALNYASFDSVIFPTTFTGMTGYIDGYAILQYAMENMSNLTSIKYQTPALPPIQSGSAFGGINSQGTVLYPCGGTGYAGNLKPSNFAWEAYGC